MRWTCTTRFLASFHPHPYFRKDFPVETEAARLIGAGLATIALAGAGIGIGNIFGNYVSAAIRNPSAAPKVFGNVLLGFALTEAIALFALLIAFLILFAV